MERSDVCKGGRGGRRGLISMVCVSLRKEKWAECLRAEDARNTYKFSFFTG